MVGSRNFGEDRLHFPLLISRVTAPNIAHPSDVPHRDAAPSTVAPMPLQHIAYFIVSYTISRYDGPRRVSVLGTVEASRASATQRKGRTGRVGPGVCYRLYTRPFESLMPDRSIPEMLRTELQSTCLQAKALVPTSPIVDTLGKAMDPPSDGLMGLARAQLEGLGAITMEVGSDDGSNESGWQGEGLTYLGRRLARLSMEPQIGRMLLLGAAFKCVDPTATAAACYATGSPFLSLAARREEIIRNKFDFRADGDIATSIKAFTEWEDIVLDYGRKEATDWAYSRNLRATTLATIQSTKRQMLMDLSRMGFFSKAQYEDAPYGEPGPNLRSPSKALVSGLQFSGLCTNLAKRFQATDKKNAMHTTEDSHVTVHTNSMYNPMWSRHDRFRGRSAGMYAYSEKVIAGGVPTLRETTPARPIEVLLFGGHELEAAAAPPPTQAEIAVLCGQIDKWILAIGDRDDFEPIYSLRWMLEGAFLRRVKMTGDDRPFDEAIFDTVVDVLEADAAARGHLHRRAPIKGSASWSSSHH